MLCLVAIPNTTMLCLVAITPLAFCRVSILTIFDFKNKESDFVQEWGKKIDLMCVPVKHVLVFETPSMKNKGLFCHRQKVKNNFRATKKERRKSVYCVHYSVVNYMGNILLIS